MKRTQDDDDYDDDDDDETKSSFRLSSLLTLYLNCSFKSHLYILIIVFLLFFAVVVVNDVDSSLPIHRAGSHQHP